MGHVGVYQSTQWNAPAQLDNLIKTQALSQELRYTTQGEKAEDREREMKRESDKWKTGTKRERGIYDLVWNNGERKEGMSTKGNNKKCLDDS
jgi:hypothetical protein